MNPGARSHELPPTSRRREPGGVAWPSVIAIVFAAAAAVSFAVDQSVTLSTEPQPAPAETTGR